MTSAVEICNQALSHIRAGGINSLSEASFAAQTCSLHYDPTRDWLLELHSWQFAHQTKDLALLDLTTPEWYYVYSYPSDTIRVNYLFPGGFAAGNINAANSLLSYYGTTTPEKYMRQTFPYKVFNLNGTRAIGTNVSEAKIDYQRIVEDPNDYSRGFIQTLTYLLASKIAVAIIGAEKGMRIRQEMLVIYQQHLDSAIDKDLNEQLQDVPDSEFITVR